MVVVKVAGCNAGKQIRQPLVSILGFIGSCCLGPRQPVEVTHLQLQLLGRMERWCQEQCTFKLLAYRADLSETSSTLKLIRGG